MPFIPRLSQPEQHHRQTLTQPGISVPSKTDFKEYEITFDVQPYPEVGKEIQSNDYRLQLIITKKPH